MFMVTNFFSVFITFYGMLGLWSTTVGYHHVRDLWIYNILFGSFQAPYYAYAQTMMSEVTPRGYENMFFGLFGITNRAVSILPLYLLTITNDGTSQVSLDQMSSRQSSIQRIIIGWVSHSYLLCVLRPVLSSGSWILRRVERIVESTWRRENCSELLRRLD